jgi:predicted transcriptional regulator
MGRLRAPENGNGKSLLDLAPLERDCMNVLWPMGEATVREIRDALAPTRPRAYTTIMTIMDRLARKGVVSRRKAGRAYVYRPNISADETRERAVGQLVENFFAGSREALLSHLTGGATRVAAAPVLRAKMAAASAGAGAPAARGQEAAESPIDETLL